MVLLLDDFHIQGIAIVEFMIIYVNIVSPITYDDQRVVCKKNCAAG